MSKWLDRALAAVAADRPSDPKMPNTPSVVSTFSADSPTAKGISLNTTTEGRPKGTKGANDTRGIRQKQFAKSRFGDLPRAWGKAFAALRASSCPSHITPDRWEQILSDADRLLDWVPILEAMGWVCADVYGRDDLDRKSLAWLVCGQRIGPVTSVAVTLRGADGSTSHVYRRTEK